MFFISGQKDFLFRAGASFLLFSLLFLWGCGYHTQAGQKDSCVLAPGTRLALTKIINSSLRPELNILFRSELCEELSRQAAVLCTEKEQADFLARLEISEFLEDADLKGLNDKTERFAISITARLMIYNVHDMSLFWSSGPVKVRETYFYSSMRPDTVRRAVRLVCEEMTSRLFRVF